MRVCVWVCVRVAWCGVCSGFVNVCMFVYLALGADAHVAHAGRVGLVQRGLDAEVGERVLAEDGARVQVGRHEPALARQCLRDIHERASLRE